MRPFPDMALNNPHLDDGSFEVIEHPEGIDAREMISRGDKQPAF